jgi:tetratricopeptide (TPR) repeat protein
MMERATGVSHNPRQYTRLAMFLDEKGRAQEALQLMRDVVAKHPAYDKSRFYFVTQLERLHMWDELLAVSRDGTRYHPQEPAYWFYVGEVSVSKGDIKEGLLAYRKCLTLNPPVVVQTRIRDQLKNYAPGGK